MLRSSLTLLIFLLLTISVKAQKTGDDKKYSPQNMELDERGKYKSKNSNVKRNAFYFEPFLLAKSLISATYERELHPKGISCTTTLGYHFYEDLVMKRFINDRAHAEFRGAQNRNALDYDEYFEVSSHAGLGPFFQASLRFFNLEYNEHLDGTGFELIYRWSTQQYTFPNELYDSRNFNNVYPEPSTEKLIHSALFLAYRSQYTGSGRKPPIYGVSFGLGVRRLQFPSYSRLDLQNEFGSSVTKIVRNGDDYESAVAFAVLLTYSIGFAW